MTCSQKNKSELAGWSFVFCTFLYEKHKVEPNTLNWANIEKKYFEKGENPLVAAKQYLKEIKAKKDKFREIQEWAEKL